MIAVVGSNNVDVVLTVDHFTRAGETQKCTALNYFPGGKGANQAVAARKLGAEVYFLTCVGNDGSAQFAIENLKKAGLDKGIKEVDSPNGMAIIEVEASGNNRIVIYPGANAYLTENVVESAKNELLKTDILLLQNEIPFSATLHAAHIFHEAGKLVIFDPAPSKDIGKEIFQYVDIITPNESEAVALVGDLPPEMLIKELKKLGCKNVLLKLGEKGIIFSGELGEFSLDAFKVIAIDTTAAGDTFNGALAVAVENGFNIIDAVKFASAAAAISVTRKGAQPSCPTLKEVKSFLNERGVRV
ncbi:ribokinase [Kosmotoga pacifica]|uniref:Ribokinase n=1 Tax=Kosmotoga pacifica TaxID=1330330 RepID=A0A0G2Z7T8_9BACT|nr:ribokinase [Kosmotoga pacifica]AKI97665.1 ribokinase [Kosmotoga pacifica]